MEPLALRFADGRVEGEGQDCIGSFTFAGTYTDAGELSMVKQYTGGHAVRYEGRVDGEGEVVGQWSVSSDWFGPFALKPIIADVGQLPIATIPAAPNGPGHRTRCAETPSRAR
jgi:hypothetical protein